MAASILYQYGTKSLYGQGIYGGTPTAARGSNRTGTDFDIFLNGVGLKLYPQGKKSYDKHNAQTFSYNPKTLFKQGDGAALAARDLYYWTRLEHSRWDGGETYEPWAPDPSDPTRLNHKYAESFGFDVSDPHRLTHLREVFTSPSYETIVGTDAPLAYWLLADHNGQSQMFDQILNNRTPGTYAGNVTGDILPGPVVNDANPVTGFDGLTAYGATGGQIPFNSTSVTPTNAWSLEAWVNHAVLPQPSAVMALIGTESPAGSAWNAAVVADSPTHRYRLDEASPGTGGHTVLDSGVGTHMNLWAGDYRFTGQATGITVGASLVNGDTDNSYNFPGSGQGIVEYDKNNAAQYQETTTVNNFSVEVWCSPTALPAASDQTIVIIGDWDTVRIGGFMIRGTDFHIVWNTADVLFDTGVVAAVNGLYHLVGTLDSSNKLNLYVNGVHVLGPTSVTPSASGVGIAIGAGTQNGGGQQKWFNGRIDEVAVYDQTILTQARVSAHYDASNPVGGFGMAVGDGAGGTGSLLCAKLPGVGWVNSGYSFATEGLTSGKYLPWWQRPKLGPVDLSLFNGGASTLSSGSPNYQGAWYHVVLTYDGTSIRFYVNGALVGTVAATPKSAPAHAIVGATGAISSTGVVSNTSNYFKGLLCMVAVYSTTLTLARIQAHYNQGTGATSAVTLTPNQSYARFVETYNGNLYINQSTTNVMYSTDGGGSWTGIPIPGGDVTAIAALWSKGSKIYVATANNIYTGDQSGLATFNGVNPAIAGVTAGIYYSGQLYVGIGTSLYYVDPATGIKTLLYNTNDFTITFIEAFQGKIWFGGTNGRATRLFTWTNNTLPPSPANGTGAQIQDGTIPYGFIVRCSTVYLNTLLIGGTIAGDTTSEGQGAVYYVTSSGQMGQLCVLGPLMKDIRGTGLDYGVRSMWGALNMLWMGYSYNTGIARYDFGPGAFSTHVTIYKSRGSLGQVVLAVAYYNGKALFATKDGNIWKESSNKVNLAYLVESEFHELPFLTKMIDGAEGRHSALLDQQRVQVEMSFDQGSTWNLLGENSNLGSESFDFPQDGVASTHWTSRILSYRGTDATKAPEINGWSIRFAPQNSPKHEWLLELYLPVLQRTVTGAVLTDAGNKLLAQLWASRESGTRVDFTDRDGKKYKVLVVEMHQREVHYQPPRASAGQSQISSTIEVELLEVQAV